MFSTKNNSLGKTTALLFICIFPLLAAPAFSDAITGRQIMKEMEQKMRGNSSQGRIKMEIPKTGRELVADFWMEGTDNALIKIVEPAKQSGQVTLKSGKMLWVYDPKLEKPAKISPAYLIKTWEGSDFTYDDMIKATTIVNDYNHRLTGTVIVRDKELWKIESVPNPGVPVLWGKLEFLVGKDFLPRRQEFYDEKGRLVKTLEFSEFRTMGGRLFPAEWKMTDMTKTGSFSVIKYQKISFNLPIKPYTFSFKSLQ
ncbi:MAG: outer membrane lipoprotein-sorting protein [Candidatus Omnitrophica bacterium]|nr:outer membrane lipoprotein-sorting protein [Candidatus Omnitrophota bacterium]